MAEFHTVGKAEDLPEFGGKEVVIEGKRLCVFKHKGEVFATSAECPHKGAPMACSWVENGTVSCALHGWQFDLRTGVCLNVPGQEIKVYPVEVRNGSVLLKVD